MRTCRGGVALVSVPFLASCDDGMPAWCVRTEPSPKRPGSSRCAFIGSVRFNVQPGTCTRIVSTLFFHLGTWVHYLLIFLYVILAARMLRLGIMRSDADGPCVRNGFDCDPCFFGCKRTLGHPWLLKGFQTPGFVIEPVSSANSWIRIALLCDASARERACSCSSVAWVKRAVRLEECVSAGVRVARGTAALFAATPPVHLAGAVSRWRSSRWRSQSTSTLPTAPPGAVVSGGVCLFLSVRPCRLAGVGGWVVGVSY